MILCNLVSTLQRPFEVDSMFECCLGASQLELTANHVAMRAQKCRKILQEMAEGTLPNLVFTDEKKFDIQQVVSQQNDGVWASSSSTEGRIVTRRQNPQSVIVWTAVTETGRSPLLFMPSGVKLNSQRCMADILEGCLLPWAKKHFQGVSWPLQQDAAPSHASKITQSWIKKKITSFINKEAWSARSPDLPLLVFSIYPILQTKALLSPPNCGGS